MGYLHINNLYKDQSILMFKECYALEKIHGTSAHIGWNFETKTINYFSGGEKHENFVKLFDKESLIEKLSLAFPTYNVIVFGEAYGGKQQGMSNTYGKELKFIGFEVKVGDHWLNVPNAEEVCQLLNIEFVEYVKCSTDLESLNFERDRPSTQAIRNGCGNDKKREGVVLKPLIELKTNNGDRIIAKHKGEEFKETKTPREVTPGQLEVLTKATEIAEEWVTEMRLEHVLQKLPNVTIENTRDVIEAMIEDVYREAKGEIIESKEVSKAIGSKAAILFKRKITKVNHDK